MWGRHFTTNQILALLGLAQAVTPPLVCAAVLVATTQLLGIPFSVPYLLLAIIAALLCTLVMPPSLSEQQAAFSSGWTIASQIGIAWCVVVGALLLLGYALKESDFFSRRALFAWFVLTPVIMAATMLLVRKLAVRVLLSSGQGRSAVVCGVNRASQRLIQSIRERPELGLVLKGVFDDRSAQRLGYEPASGLIGRFSDMARYVRDERIEAVFIATPFSHLERTEKLLAELQDTTASIYYVPDVFVFDLIQSRTTDLNGIPIVALRDTPFSGWPGLVKRSSDIVLASLMILIALPLMLLIAFTIKLSSPGSIIFKQRRYGLNGEEIIVWKFRTMITSDDGDHVEQASRNDSRVTPIGRILRRYSLDELPQLFNVLQGRMSVVGPRPHAVAHNEAYRRIISNYMVRHKVAPGITGLAQVNGCRGETADIADMQRRVEYDLDYLRRWSLALDFKILLRTFAILFRDDKAY